MRAGGESVRSDPLLRRPRFAALLAGMSVSALGDPLSAVAGLVIAYSAFHTPAALGVLVAAQGAAAALTGSLAGGLADRLDRRRTVAMMDMARGLLLVFSPAFLERWPVLVLAVLVVSSAANALVQPARAAAVPSLVRVGELGRANSLVASGVTLGGLLGYPLAGVMLSLVHTSALLTADGLTFVLASLSMLLTGPIGGGGVGSACAGGMSIAWRIGAARRPLVVAAFAALLIGASFPGLFILARDVAPPGAVAYTVLELFLSAGAVLGGLVMSRAADMFRASAVPIGLLLMGSLSVGMSVSPSLLIVATLLLVASVGNPIYAVGNVTQLLTSAGDELRGRVMAARFTVTQLAAIAGSAGGGLVASTLGGRATYAVIGVGLCLLGIGAASREALGAPRSESLGLGVDPEAV